MKILVDTHFVIMLADDRMEEMSERHGALILQEDSEVLVSLVSLWEVEIKSRITSGGGVADGLGHRLKAGDGDIPKLSMAGRGPGHPDFRRGSGEWGVDTSSSPALAGEERGPPPQAVG